MVQKSFLPFLIKSKKIPAQLGKLYGVGLRPRGRRRHDHCNDYIIFPNKIQGGFDMARENLKAARKAAGFTQKQIAEYLHVSERHYKFIESGHTTGNVELWDKLEDLFKVHQRVLREIHPGKVDNR